MRIADRKNIANGQSLGRYDIEFGVVGVGLHHEEVEGEVGKVVHRFVFGNRKAAERAAELQVQSASSAQVGVILHAADKRED